MGTTTKINKVKTEEVTRTFRITIRLTEKEHAQLISKAQRAGTNSSEFIRTCIRKSTVTERMNPDHTMLYRGVIKTGYNINSILKFLNTYKSPHLTKELEQSLKDALDHINSSLKIFRNDR